MIYDRFLITLILMLFIGWGLIHTGTTDADFSAEMIAEENSLKATTLEFFGHDTANENKITTLFNTSGLLPSGFDIRAIRIKRSGQENFKYALAVQKTFGDDLLCNELNLEVWYKGKTVYNDKLMNFKTTANIKDKDDWIFFISLANNDTSLSLKSCEFEFKFSSFYDNPDQIGGLNDQELIKNKITSGSW